MADGTLEHYSELADKVIRGEHPIMPQPTWGQDPAYLGFVLDSLRSENMQMMRIMKAFVEHCKEEPGAHKIAAQRIWQRKYDDLLRSMTDLVENL